MSSTIDANIVRASTLGDELDKNESAALASIMGARQLRDQELVVTENAADHALYLLAEGRLEVLSKTEGQDIIVYTMSIGECAGTRAFVDHTPRKATLRAGGDTTVYTLERQPFESLLEKHPVVVYKVMRALFRITHANLMRMNQETEQLSNYINKSHGRY